MMFRLVNDTLLAQEARALGDAERRSDPAADGQPAREPGRDRLEKEEILDRAEPTEEEIERGLPRGVPDDHVPPAHRPRAGRGGRAAEAARGRGGLRGPGEGALGRPLRPEGGPGRGPAEDRHAPRARPRRLCDGARESSAGPSPPASAGPSCESSPSATPTPSVSRTRRRSVGDLVALPQGRRAPQRPGRPGCARPTRSVDDEEAVGPSSSSDCPTAG